MEVPGPSSADSSVARSALRLTTSLATGNKARLLWYRETLKLSWTWSTSHTIIMSAKSLHESNILYPVWKWNCSWSVKYNYTHSILVSQKAWKTADTPLEAMQLFLEELRQGGEHQPSLLLSLDARDDDEERDSALVSVKCFWSFSPYYTRPNPLSTDWRHIIRSAFRAEYLV